MRPIEMVDLYSQYLKIKTEIDEAIQDVIRSSVFIKGGKVVEFENHLGNYLKSNVIACGNGTDALQIAFMAIGLKPGDEVITTPFTFVATVEVLALLGLKPVFADVDARNFNIDPDSVEKSITPKTRAIVPVHLFGQCADMEKIMRIARKFQLFVIEDACQALGTDYYYNDGTKAAAGTIGDIGCNSFFPSKNLGAYGDAGAIYASDENLVKTIRSIANHGMTKKYHYDRIGVNSRLDNIQAAILDVKLKYLDDYIKARQTAASFYDQKLRGIDDIQLPERATFSSHTFHQYTIRTSERSGLQEFLQKKNIPTMIYYPSCLHLQPAYQYLGYRKGDFPVAEKLTDTVLSLPMHTELDLEQLEYITSQIIQYFSQKQNNL
jgi:UDP-2-acetamido-2-deoxy-ribo-hexuluronate aminotransferase